MGRKHGRCTHARHQPFKIAKLSGIAAQEPVLAELPEIAAARGRVFRQRRQRVRWLRCVAKVGDQQIDFGGLETGERDIEPVRGQDLDELAELKREHFAIPAGLLGDLVIGDQVGALLRIG